MFNGWTLHERPEFFSWTALQTGFLPAVESATPAPPDLRIPPHRAIPSTIAWSVLPPPRHEGSFGQDSWITPRSSTSEDAVKLPRRLLRVLLVAACISPVPILAGQTRVGLHGGLTRATFSDLDALVEQEARSGVRFGVSATVPVSGSLDVRFAGSYVQAGGGFALPNIFEFESGIAPVDSPAGTVAAAARRVAVGLNLDYFRLSALARAALPMESSSVSVYFLAGPFAGFRTACSMSIAEEGVSLSADCDEADVELSSTTDFGLSGGAGLEVGVSSSMGVALEALYDLGLQDLDGAKTRVFSVLAGLVFSL